MGKGGSGGSPQGGLEIKETKEWVERDLFKGRGYPNISVRGVGVGMGREEDSEGDEG